MPYKETKLPSGKYQVKGPSGVHAKGTTKKKADAQIRLMQGVEHGMVPRKTGTKGDLDHEIGHNEGIGKSKMSTKHSGEHLCKG